MNPWEVLCIPPASDEAAVRQAYAKLLKTRRPEDDAQAFQNLRSAYEQALAVCRGRLKNLAAQELHAGQDAAQEKTPPLPDLRLPFTGNDFMDQFCALAKDYASYAHQAQWLTFLNKAYDLNYWERRALGKPLMLTLADFPLLPSFVWNALEETFNWEQNRGRLESQYQDAELDWLKREGEIARLLRTEEIIACQGGYEYLLDTRDFYIRRDRIKNPSTDCQFHKVYAEHDELPAAMRLRFSLLKNIGDWEALSAPDSVFQGNDSGLLILLLRGEAQRHKKDYAGARNTYEDILRQHPNHIDALRWSALYMERLGDVSLASERYRLVLDILPQDVYSRCVLKRLTAVPAGKHRSWRDWVFSASHMFGRLLLLAVAAVWCLFAIYHFFLRALSLLR